MKNLFEFLIGLIITVLLVAGGTVIYLTLTKNPSGETFYVAAPDGAEITETYSLDISPYENYEFTVKGDVSVQIIPNVSDDNDNFEFKHNGARKSFFAETNLNNAFDIEREGNTLRFSCKQFCVSLKNILEKIYDGEKIEMPSDYENTTKRLFSLVIKENGSIAYRTIYFGIDKSLNGIYLSEEKIVF